MSVPTLQSGWSKDAVCDRPNLPFDKFDRGGVEGKRQCLSIIREYAVCIFLDSGNYHFQTIGLCSGLPTGEREKREYVCPESGRPNVPCQRGNLPTTAFCAFIEERLSKMAGGRAKQRISAGVIWGFATVFARVFYDINQPE